MALNLSAFYLSFPFYYMGVESLKRREASPMEVAFTLFWLKISGPLSITIK